jgi:hypothetical protein
MTDQEAKQAFEKEYHSETKEIIVLFTDASGSGGAGKTGQTLWEAMAYFLGYVDVATGELKRGDGRIVWLITDEERKDGSYFNRFKKGGIYRLRVRELISKTVPAGMIPSYANRFSLVETLEENVRNDALLAILEEYRKPVIITDPTLGEFELNKEFNHFEGYIQWLGQEIHVTLDVNPDSKATWTKALKILKTLFDEQTKRDAEFRAFAAKELTELANDWAEEGSAPITQQDFKNRIRLSELSVNSVGSFIAYYIADDEMFTDHAITVYGGLKKGLKSANIEG